MLERLCGNAQLKADLGTALARKTLAHSVLLVGEKGSGTGYAARCLAADYLFPEGGPHAEAVLRSESGELNEVRGSGASGDINVASVREVRSDMYATSLSSAGRCAIFYGAETMNQSSANSLLKVLEEPPEGVLFILTANSLAGILPTIRSRCATYFMAPVEQSACVAAVCAAVPGADPARAALLARVFDGRIGSCREVLADPARSERFANAQQLCALLAGHQEFEALALLSAVEGDKPAAALLLSDCAALAAATLQSPGTTPLAPAQAARVIDLSDEARRRLRRNVNPKLTLTLFGAHGCEE